VGKSDYSAAYPDWESKSKRVNPAKMKKNEKSCGKKKEVGRGGKREGGLSRTGPELNGKKSSMTFTNRTLRKTSGGGGGTGVKRPCWALKGGLPRQSTCGLRNSRDAFKRDMFWLRYSDNAETVSKGRGGKQERKNQGKTTQKKKLPGGVASTIRSFRWKRGLSVYVNTNSEARPTKNKAAEERRLGN